MTNSQRPFHRGTRALCVLTAIGALSGCVAPAPGGGTTQEAPAASSALANACIQQLRVVTNNSFDQIVVLGSDPRGSLRDYTLEIGGSGVWGCQVNGAGIVQQIDLLNSDGSNLI